VIWTLSLVVKSTLVLAAAIVGARALRRSSASVRHVVWCLALGCLVALPLMSTAFSALGWTLWPASPPDALRQLETAAWGLEGSQAAPGLDGTRLRGMGWWDWALVVWLAGAGLALARLALGALLAALVVRRARPVTDPEWSALLSDAMTTLGVRRPVELRASDAVDVPNVWGQRSPVVLLPETAASWPEGRRRAILAHELAHVVRHDGITRNLAYVVRALYWPHPLAWWAVSSLHREAERACDDLVLRGGATAPEYAQHLLEAARGLVRSSKRLLTASAGIERSRLGDRVLAVLDEHQDRRVPSRRVVALFASGALLAIGALAATDPAAAGSRGGSPLPQGSTESALGDWIIHEPFGCLVEGRFAELDATIEPASRVGEARIYFSSSLSDKKVEYWVVMTQQGSRFVGRLPRPRAAASPVRYRIEARGTDGRVASTDHYEAVVATGEARCPKGVRIAPRASSIEAVTVHSSATP
jgi:beta-lactamase regulating signal transducer with metallopeptidase domain